MKQLRDSHGRFKHQSSIMELRQKYDMPPRDANGRYTDKVITVHKLHVYHPRSPRQVVPVSNQPLILAPLQLVWPVATYAGDETPIKIGGGIRLVVWLSHRRTAIAYFALCFMAGLLGGWLGSVIAIK